MWCCVKLLLVVCVVVDLSVAQHGVALPGLHQVNTGVPLQPVGARAPHQGNGHQAPNFNPVFHGDTETVVVPLREGAGVPLPVLGPGGGTAPPSPGVPPYETVRTGGVPLHQPTGLPGGGLGGIRPVRDPELDENVQRAVRLSAVQSHLQLKTEADSAVKIIEIVSAHKQVVAGLLVYLTLRVGETKCPIGAPDLHVCPLDNSEDTHICEIVIWDRPWLNISKVIDEKSRCAETEDDNDFNSWGVFTPLVSSHSEIPVQVLPQDIDEQQLGIEAFNYIDRGSESKFRGEMITFDLGNMMFDPVSNTTKVQVNVEYGFQLCLRSVEEKTDPRVCPRDGQRDHYICSVIVVHNPNHISALEVVPLLEDDDDIRCEKKRGVEEELVVPVQAPCLGCPQPAPLNDPTIMEIADFALKEYDRTATDEEDLHLVLRLIKAQTQVVAGLKYYLTVELAETDCKKTLTGVDVNRTFCMQDHDEETKICDLHVVDQPWIPARDLVAAQCYDKDDYPASNQDEFIVPIALGTGLSSAPHGSAPSFRPQSSLLGGHRPVEVDAQTMEVVKMIVDEYNKREDDSEYFKLVKVHEASSQVVSGRKYTLVVELGETNCHKLDPALGNGEHCLLDPTEEHEVCKAVVHEQAWLQTSDFRRILSLTCDDLDDYLEQQLLPTHNSFDFTNHPFLNVTQDTHAGFQVVAKNDSNVQKTAAFVTEQYNLRGDEDELYTLTQIISAYQQAASGGINYHLEIELAETRCKKYLPIADLNRCPLDHGEEREVCQAEIFVPHGPGGNRQVNKLYCDDMSEYYTRKIRGKFGPTSAFSQQAVGSGPHNGQWTAADVNDKSLVKLGHLIADEFDSRSDEDNLFIFHKLLQARKQVVSGLNYHLVVELVHTVCPKYKRRIDKTRCLPDIGEEHKVCEAHVLTQPWLKRKVVTNLRCAEKDDFFKADDSVEVLYPSVHPTAHARPVFQSQFLVRDSVESDESNERFYHPSGRTNFRRHDTEEDDSDELPSFRDRRSATGGYSPVNVSDPKVIELAAFALKSMDAISDDPEVRVVENVISAQNQVVAGLNWKLQILVSWTSCLKEDQIEDLRTCSKNTNKPSSKCDVTIYEKSWEDYIEVTEMACTPVTGKHQNRHHVHNDDKTNLRSRRAALGGFKKIDFTDPKVKEVSEFAVKTMDERTNEINVRVIEKVINAEVQTVSGKNWKLQVQLSWTTCRKNEQVQDLSTCEKDPSKPRSICDVIVYEVPWKNHMEVTNTSCTTVEEANQNHSNDNTDELPSIRRRRAALGGYEPVQLPDQNINKVAEFAVKSMDARINDPNVRVVEKVISAQKQIVSGINWKLQVQLSWTTCRKEEKVQDLSTCEKDPSKPSSICNVIVYEVPWKNHMEVTDTSCTTVEDDTQNHSNDNTGELPSIRNRRGALGGYEPVQLPDQNIDKVAEFAVTSMDARINDPNVRVVEKVISAQKQIVSGINWKFQVQLSWTTCRKNEQVQDLRTCEKDPNKPSSICDVIVYEVPWKNHMEVTNTSCTNVEDNNQDHSNDNTDELPSIRRRRAALGGYEPVQLPDQNINKVAEFAVKSMDARINDLNVRVVEKVISAQKQIVSGINWKLQVQLSWTTCRKEEKVQDLSTCQKDPSKPSSICNVIVYEVPWKNHMEVTDTSCTTVEDDTQNHSNDNTGEPPSIRNRRAALGGYEPVQLPDQNIDKVAEFAVRSMDARINDPNVRVVEKVISAQKQIVSGINWKFQIQLSWTKCRKEENVQDLSTCEKDPSKPSNICDVIVYEVPWKNHMEVTNTLCTTAEANNQNHSNDNTDELPSIRRRRAALGGYKPVQLPDQNINKVAEFAVKSMDARINDPNVRVVEKVISAQKQIVSGINWKLQVQLSWTTCRKEEKVHDLSTCEKDPNKPSSICNVIVYEVPWKNHMEVTNTSCTTVEDDTQNHSNDSTGELPSIRNRRAALGGYEPVQLPDQNIDKVAEFAVKSMDARINDPNVRVVEKVISAQKQIVSGINWKFQVQLSWTTCRKDEQVQDLSTCERDPSKPSSICNVIVYEVPWKNHMEVTDTSCTTVEDDNQNHSNDSTGELPSIRNRRAALGGYEPVQLPDQNIDKVAEFAVKSMDARINDPNVRVVEKVISAQKQIVSGINWKFQVQLSWTTCRKDEQVQDLSTCERDPSKPNSICNVIVYEVPWKNHMEVTNTSCTTVEDKRVQ
ncbi:uncharacterized protein [Cherax quadricarinatus]|uniref:uncharacterized protein isoform X3 n=1 Tax=Cherax quadricarinatus TaxID=27406 RepID=UPI00387EA177